MYEKKELTKDRPMNMTHEETQDQQQGPRFRLELSGICGAWDRHGGSLGFSIWEVWCTSMRGILVDSEEKRRRPWESECWSTYRRVFKMLGGGPIGTIQWPMQVFWSLLGCLTLFHVFQTLVLWSFDNSKEKTTTHPQQHMEGFWKAPAPKSPNILKCPKHVFPRCWPQDKYFWNVARQIASIVRPASFIICYLIANCFA